MPNTNSLIVYEGPSTIDGAPIVVILTGLDQSSANEKTGNLVQSFIIRSDVEPHQALKTGDDASVCGLCPHRPLIVKMLAKVGIVSSPCYVKVHESVLSVFRAYRRGSYARATSVAQVAAVLRGRKLRLGTYGDPPDPQLLRGGASMSASNPEHRATPRPYPWPFPVTLPGPGHAPDPKPARAPSRPLPPDTSTLPDAPF